MALAKKKIVAVKKKVAVKKAPVKKVLKKKVAVKKAPVKKLKMKGGANKIPKGNVAKGKGMYPYEPYRAKKNVGNAAKNACLQGKGTPEVIAAVMEAFPECNISPASVGYYRSALRKEGYDL